MQKPPAYHVAAADRVLQLIVLLMERERIGVKDAAEHLGVAPSTAHRLLAVLCYRNFAVQDHDRRYRAGPQIVGPLTPNTSRAAIRDAVRPHLERLHDELNETAHLVVLAGSDVQFVDGVEGDQTLRVGLRTGMRLPAYCSSAGRAMLAALRPDEVRRLHQHGLRPWPSARIRNVDSLVRHLSAVRKQGYGANLEESEHGVSAIGACVHDQDGRPLAGISVAVPTARFRRSDSARYIAGVKGAAREVEASLSHISGASEPDRSLASFVSSHSPTNLSRAAEPPVTA